MGAKLPYVSASSRDATRGNDYKREPALRLFASEIAKTTVELERSADDKFATAFAVSPTGAKINRLFHVGVLTEIEERDGDFITGRIIDPTGAVHIRAGNYQPEVAATMKQLADNLPMFVAVTGKLNIYRLEDGQVYVSIRPESLTQVTETERDIWIQETTRQTLDRIKTLATSPDELPPEVKAVIDDCYASDLNDLKDIVRIAAGLVEENTQDSAQESAGKEETGKEAVDKPETNTEKPQTDSAKPDAESTGAKADKAQPEVKKPEAPKKTDKAQADKVPEKAPKTESVADKTDSGITEDKVNDASKLLIDLCTDSGNGTVGANQFLDKIKEAKIASAEKASAVVKALFDRGMAYEPQLGRLKAVV